MASELVVDADDCGFGDCVVLDERCFDLGSGETVTANVDDVVNTASDPVVAFVVTSGSVTCELLGISKRHLRNAASTHVVSLVDIEVSIHISLVCSPDCSSHARPWLLECQDSFDIVSVNFFARNRVNNRRLDAKEWKRCTTGLGGSYTSKRSNDIRSSLGLPVCLKTVRNF